MCLEVLSNGCNKVPHSLCEIMIKATTVLDQDLQISEDILVAIAMVTHIRKKRHTLHVLLGEITISSSASFLRNVLNILNIASSLQANKSLLEVCHNHSRWPSSQRFYFQICMCSSFFIMLYCKASWSPLMNSLNTVCKLQWWFSEYLFRMVNKRQATWGWVYCCSLMLRTMKLSWTWRWNNNGDKETTEDLFHEVKSTFILHHCIRSDGQYFHHERFKLFNEPTL